MEIQARYGIQQTFYFPLVVAGGTDLAVSADYTPASGDARIMKDGGTWAATSNTVVDETEGWALTLTAAEMQARRILVNIIDLTATKVIEDQCLVINTQMSGQIEASNSIFIIQCDNTALSPTTTQADFNMVSPVTTEEATADHLNGRLLTATGLSDASLAQQTDITDYELNGGRMRISYTALPEAPPNNSYWVIT